MLEEGGSAIDVEVTIGHVTENVTFLDNAAELDSGNQTSPLVKSAADGSGKRKATGAEMELSSELPTKVVAHEIEDGSHEENAALLGGIGRDSRGKLCPSNDFPQKPFTKWGLSELEMMARTKAVEVGPGSNVKSSDGMVRVPTVDSSGVPPEVDAVCTEKYPSQSARILKDIFELNRLTRLDAGHQTTSFSADQMIQFAKVVG